MASSDPVTGERSAKIAANFPCTARSLIRFPFGPITGPAFTSPTSAATRSRHGRPRQSGTGSLGSHPPCLYYFGRWAVRIGVSSSCVHTNWGWKSVSYCAPFACMSIGDVIWQSASPSWPSDPDLESETLREWLGVRERAVSYTHLTLPTMAVV